MPKDRLEYDDARMLGHAMAQDKIEQRKTEWNRSTIKAKNEALWYKMLGQMSGMPAQMVEESLMQIIPDQYNQLKARFMQSLEKRGQDGVQ